MIEILQTIILACQVGNGFKVIEHVDKYQKKCQKELIKCIDKEYTVSLNTSQLLKKCLLER